MVKSSIARAARAGLILSCVALAPGAAGAEDAPGWSYDLSNHLMSPYCPGRSLPDCPSPQAAELRQWIVTQEHEGRTRAEVEEQLFARYGEVILQAPKASGFGLAAYVIPVLLSLAGAALLVVFLRRQTAGAVPRAAAAPGAPTPPLDPELERALDEELRRR